MTKARQLRLSKGIKASHLARELGISRQWFYKVESGDALRLTPMQWTTWSNALGVPLTELLASYTPQQTA